MSAKATTTPAAHDLFEEDPAPFPDAIKWIPPRKGGKRAHLSTLHRWAQVGIRGVKLEVIQIGGAKMTTRPALSRFFQRLSSADSGQPLPTRSAAQRQRSIERAEREMKAGF